MHTGIELDMDWEIVYPFLLGSLDQFVQQMEVVDFGLEFIVEQRLEGGQFRVHNDDGTGDARLSEFGTFIGHGYSQVIHPMVLQGLGYFIRACSIRRSLDHTHHFGIGFQLATVMVQIVYQGIEIDFENGFMHLQFEAFGNQVEMKTPRTFDEYHLISKIQQPVG